MSGDPTTGPDATGRDPDRDTEVVPRGTWRRHATLRDGTRVLLRRIEPSDREALAAGFGELSPSSRYLRFHHHLEDLTPEQLTYLTEVDHVEHEAIVAIDLDRPGHPGIGVARWIRDPYDRGIAEAFVTVADRYQGQGAGTALLGALTARGRQEGIEVFRHHVLASNEAMLAVFDDLGATREPQAGGLWRVDLPLPSGPDDLPDSPGGRAFLEAAKGRWRFMSLIRPVLRYLDLGSTPPRSDEAEPADADQQDEDLTLWLAHRDERGSRWPDGDPGPDDGDAGADGDPDVA